MSQAKCEEAKPVYVYRNIPFAKPPVGNLRFMPPQPADSWEGIRDGTEAGKLPMQPLNVAMVMERLITIPMESGISDEKMDEDSLHLTVYTPESSKGKNLPVMVWFYGGAFQVGGEIYYDGTALAGMNNVILVVPNYRVSIWGFLSFGKSSKCPGNRGIRDQQLALKWVQENIESFGGDKSNVTIFGESAGGISVHFHLLSPLSRGLFHKAISHSGQAMMPAGMFVSERQNAEALAYMLKELGIDEKDEAKLLDILQKIPVEKFATLQGRMTVNGFFHPVLDGEVLVKKPHQRMLDMDVPKIPYMIGYNMTEGQYFIPIMRFTPGYNEGMSAEAARKLPFKIADEFYEAATKLYLKEEYGNMKYSRLYAQITEDALLVVPAEIATKVHSDAGADVYKYLGAFRLRMHHDAEYGKQVVQKPDWCICDHFDEVPLTFGSPFVSCEATNGVRFTDEEAALSRKWMTYLTNFAKTGNPNEGEKVNVIWPKYTSQGEERLEINHEFKVGRDSRKKVVDFWCKIIEESAA